jgi:hypothetical protein
MCRTTEAFACCTAEHSVFAVGPVVRQALLVLVELLFVDVALVVLTQVNTPIRHGQRPGSLAHFAIGGDGLGVLIAAKDLGAGV